MRFDFDALHDEARQEWVEVACSEDDPSAGTVHVCLRELPDREYQRLLLLYQVSGRSTFQTSQTLQASEAGALEAIEQVAQTTPLFLDVTEKFDAIRLELIQHMVIDHSSASFVVEFPSHASATQIREYLSSLGSSPDEIEEALTTRRAELLFQPADWLYKGKPQRGAGEKTLRLYQQDSAFLSSLFSACKAFQSLAWETPQQVWERTAKERERRAKTVSLTLTEELTGINGALLHALGMHLSEKQLDTLQRGGRLLLQFPATETSPLA